MHKECEKQIMLINCGAWFALGACATATTLLEVIFTHNRSKWACVKCVSKKTLLRKEMGDPVWFNYKSIENVLFTLFQGTCDCRLVLQTSVNQPPTDSVDDAIVADDDYDDVNDVAIENPQGEQRWP